MSQLTRDKVVDEWLAEAELAVKAAQDVVEAAERELLAAQGQLDRLRAAREVASEADAVVREQAGAVPVGTASPTRAEQAAVAKWRPEADLAQLPRDYPQIARVVKDAGADGIRAIEVHRLLDWPDTDSSRQNVRNRLQRLTQKGWLRLVSRGVYAWAASA